MFFQRNYVNIMTKTKIKFILLSIHLFNKWMDFTADCALQYLFVLCKHQKRSEYNDDYTVHYISNTVRHTTRVRCTFVILSSALLFDAIKNAQEKDTLEKSGAE